MFKYVKRKSSITFIAVLLLTSCVSRQERDDMQARLAQMAQWNTDDTVFTARHTAEAQTLADWFDRHGTPNEQLKAHYLLGRTYADRGEAPHALDCYQTAISHADTTSQDCDYHTLGCVYSQMADLFHRQLLLNNEVASRKLSKRYAELANEPLNAISSLKLSAGAFIQLNQADSAEKILHDAIRQYQRLGETQEVLQASTILMYIYMDNPNRRDELKKLIDRYDAKSSLFDDHHELHSNKRLFYFYKGKYFEGVGHLDSAEYYS